MIMSSKTIPEILCSPLIDEDVRLLELLGLLNFVTEELMKGKDHFHPLPIGLLHEQLCIYGTKLERKYTKSVNARFQQLYTVFRENRVAGIDYYLLTELLRQHRVNWVLTKPVIGMQITTAAASIKSNVEKLAILNGWQELAGFKLQSCQLCFNVPREEAKPAAAVKTTPGASKAVERKPSNDNEPIVVMETKDFTAVEPKTLMSVSPVVKAKKDAAAVEPDTVKSIPIQPSKNTGATKVPGPQMHENTCPKQTEGEAEQRLRCNHFLRQRAGRRTLGPNGEYLESFAETEKCMSMVAQCYLTTDWRDVDGNRKLFPANGDKNCPDPKQPSLSKLILKDAEDSSNTVCDAEFKATERVIKFKK